MAIPPNTRQLLRTMLTDVLDDLKVAADDLEGTGTPEPETMEAFRLAVGPRLEGAAAVLPDLSEWISKRCNPLEAVLAMRMLEKNILEHDDVIGLILRIFVAAEKRGYVRWGPKPLASPAAPD